MLRRSFCAEREYYDFEVSWKLHKLKRYVSTVDPRGRWRDLEHGGKQYRTDKGAVVNWWKASGKILFQGQGSAVSKNLSKHSQRLLRPRGVSKTKTAKVCGTWSAKMRYFER
jgi:hypothetical protein